MIRSLAFVLLLVAGLALAGVTVFGQTAASPGFQAFRPHDPLSSEAFDRFYNLDYDRAVQDFERVAQKYPDDPFAVNHLL
ncbi:MAG TPA: hypothetical protein VKG87_08355, partial [Terriglobales bacterium]|nr:hypothetical protein [Terriglobales bacterium]